MSEVNFQVKKGLTVPRGTASTPSIIFDAGDTDTGIYSPGANQLAISTNGTGRLFIDANGNVGVGTLDPKSILDANGKVYLRNSNYLAWHNGFTAESAYLYADGSSILTFGTAGTERLRITSDGKLGLGTSTPSNILHVAGTSSTPAVFERTDTTGVFIGLKDASGSFSYLGTNNGVFSIQTPGSGYSDKLVVTSAGLVGIGTTSASGLLHLAGSAASLYFEDTASSNTLSRIYKSGSSLFINSRHTTAGQIVFNSENSSGTASERARIDSSGRLLVGTSTSVTTYRTEIVDDASLNLALVTGSSNSAGNCSFLTLRRSRGSTASPSVVSSGDLTGVIDFRGYSGAASSYVPCAQISAAVDGTPDSGGDTTDMPGRLVFSVTADGASSPTEAMRIKNSGIINIANTPVYADNAAAKTGGLVDGDVYRTSTGDLKIVYT